MFKKTLGAVSVLVMSWSAFAQQYNSRDLTPPVTTAGQLNGAATNKQVGGGRDGHAYLMTGNPLSPVDLHPAGWINSMALSTDDTQQCGYGYAPLAGDHALLWSGSSASAVDLDALFPFTYCLGTHKGQQVGFGVRLVYISTTQHAMLWNGSAATAVDLHPFAYPYSKALGVHNGQQVGYVSSAPYPGLNLDTPGYHTTSQAMLWSGSAASAVNLHPAGLTFTSSEALATNGVQQGGWVYSLAGQHAVIWSGTADSVVDLHPAGYTDSKVIAMTATQQVGEGWTGPAYAAGSVRHALVWQGTAASAIDLNQYLPAGYTNAVATGVDAAGNVVGYAYNTPAYGTIPVDAIAVVFAPGAASPFALSGIALSSSNVAPGASILGTVSIGTPAPTAGVTISFLSTDATLVPTPFPVTIPAGQTSANFIFTVGGATLQMPASLKLYATDGTVSKVAGLTVTPVVNVTSVTVNAVEGGFNTSGTVTLTNPAQFGGATVSLSSGNPALGAVPASITIPQGVLQGSFSIATSAVPAPTAVTVTASFNGSSGSGTLNLTQAPVVTVASVSIPPVVGGQSTIGTVTLTNFPRGAAGAVIALASGDVGTLQVPATVTVPQFGFSATFTVNTVVVPGQKGVSVKATYNTSNITTTVSVAPIPTITIVQADYLTDLQLLKIGATTTFANSVLTFGTDPLGGAIGTMQFELGQFNGAAVMPTAPKYATVWNSNGGMATMLVTSKLSSAGGGGGGGGGSTTGPFKISVSKTGHGTVTASPNATSYAAGTVVTLTATPDPGFPWIGWAGACSGSATTCTLTMNANLSVTANFK